MKTISLLVAASAAILWAMAIPANGASPGCNGCGNGYGNGNGNGNGYGNPGKHNGNGNGNENDNGNGLPGSYFGNGAGNFYDGFGLIDGLDGNFNGNGQN